MSCTVVITGTGVITALGDTRDALHRALCEGRRGLKPVESFEAAGIDHPLAGEVVSFQAADYLGSRGLRPLNRTSQLLTVAAQLAIQDSGWTPEGLAEAEVGLIAGTMFCSAHTISDFDIRGMKEGPSRASPMDFANTVLNAAAGQAALWHRLTGVNSTVSSGGTSGIESVAYAYDMIRNGVSRALLAGGVEELCYETMYGFYNAGLLCISPGRDGARPIPFDARRNGFCLAEGAAVLMLEEAESAVERGATILATIKGYGSTFDCQPVQDVDTDVEPAVAAMAGAVQTALNDAGLDASRIDAVSCSANGQPRGDRVEAIALNEVFNGQARRVPVTAIKSMVGESLGAAGAIQTVAMVAAMKGGCLPGIAGLEQIEPDVALSASAATRDVVIHHALINALGLDGNCCVLVIGR